MKPEKNQENQETEAQHKGVYATTLKERGPVLPLGTLDGSGKLCKDMLCRRWRMKEETELGELRDRNKDANVAQYVNMVIATMYETLGHHKLSKTHETERKILLSQMDTGDIFYAYIWLRVQALGPELDVNIKCPNCGKEIAFTADLNTTEIRCADTLEDTHWEYNLLEPFEIRNKPAKTLLMQSAPWNTLESMSPQGGLNTGAAKAAMIRASIRGIKDIEGASIISPTELEEMAKRDIEHLTSMMNKKYLGPRMIVKDQCPKCKDKFEAPMDWGYDGFFGVSSQ